MMPIKLESTPNSPKAEGVSGPRSIRKSSFIKIDVFLRIFFFPFFKAFLQLMHIQKGTGTEGDAEVPKKVIFVLLFITLLSLQTIFYRSRIKKSKMIHRFVTDKTIARCISKHHSYHSKNTISDDSNTEMTDFFYDLPNLQ